MLGRIFMKLFQVDSGKSKEVAKERLRVVLVHDRINLPPKYMESIKEDMLKAVSTYMEVNEAQTQINLTKNQSAISLVAIIPVTRVKRAVLPNLPADYSEA